MEDSEYVWDIELGMWGKQLVCYIVLVTNTGRKLGYTNYDRVKNVVSVRETSALKDYPNGEIIAIAGEDADFGSFFFYFTEERVP